MSDVHGRVTVTAGSALAAVCSSAGTPAYPGRIRAVSEADQSVPGRVPWEGTVPLSEHERRQFEQIERALRASDPRLASAAHAADPRVHYKRRVIWAALGFVSGAGLLLAGLVINVILVAAPGCAVMLACSVWAVTSYRRMTVVTTGPVPAGAGRVAKMRRVAKGRRPGKRAGSGLMGRLEERWRRRQEHGP